MYDIVKQKLQLILIIKRNLNFFLKKNRLAIFVCFNICGRAVVTIERNQYCVCNNNNNTFRGGIPDQKYRINSIRVYTMGAYYYIMFCLPPGYNFDCVHVLKIVNCIIATITVHARLEYWKTKRRKMGLQVDGNNTEMTELIASDWSGPSETVQRQRV